MPEGPLCPVCGDVVELENNVPGYQPLAICPSCGWSNY